MLINLKVKTLDAQTHEFTGINNEITVRDFKDQISEKTGIAPDQQRIIYCGRVLADDKHLKDYDVDGKVLHVAERPPPLQRATSASSSAASTENTTSRERPSHHNMRNSPLFRALDGMVVGTMAIPMNGGNMHNGPTAIHPLTASSSFCMNRITVARHMLNCVNNIAAYLEDPSRGLNNVPLDILARGRWTMESTVVEVGITATDLPQTQNIVEMVQGAVSAALRRNGNTNVTVVQLPTMFSSSDGDGDGDGDAEGEPMATGGELSGASNSEILDNNASSIGESVVGNENVNSGAVGTGGDHHATDVIEVIIQDMDDATTNASSNVAQAGSAASSDSGSSSDRNSNSNSNSTSTTDGGIGSTSVGTNTDDNIQSRRTGTSVLAEVFEQMRTVWTRISPFIEQAQEMLQNEPTFDENDTTARENAQRLFDRVSEAFHYLSHAQHAISDLMLDYSQPTPRYLTCRPILVEQSGYVSSNNYMSAAAAAAAAANAFRQTQSPVQQQQQQQQTAANSLNSVQAQGTNTVPVPISAASIDPEPRERTGSSISVNNIEDDPIDDLISVPTTRGGTNSTTSTSNAGTQSTDNHQLQMARLIQAVVNSAPVDTEFHVQINAPSIVSFGMPMGAVATHDTGVRNNPRLGTESGGASSNTSTEAISDSQSSTTAAAVPNTANINNNNNNNNASNAVPHIGNQARVNTATLPTTSTQTRSTSRPQVQIGNLPTNNIGANSGRMAAPQMSAFDRFLPCNSHHIRDSSEHLNNDNGNGNGNGPNNVANSTRPSFASIHNQANAANRATSRILSDLIRRPSLTVGSSMSAPRASAAPYTRRPTTTPASSSSSASPSVSASASAGTASSTGIEDNDDPRASLSNFWVNKNNNLRSQLVEFLNDTLFEGLPINDINMERARNRAINWFSHHLLYLRQYEKAEYDSQDSVLNILRKMWPLLVEAVNDRHAGSEQYEVRVKLMCNQFVTRLYSVLIVCIGRENADLFWGQLMRHLAAPVKLRFRTEACQFLLCFINTDIPAITDMDDAGQFITYRRIDGDIVDTNRTKNTNSTENELQAAIGTDFQNFDTEMLELASTSSSNQSDLTTTNPLDTSLPSQILPRVELPKITVGSESWHASFPTAWLPLLTRDIQYQAQHPTIQSPFSDGYISGTSAKRRKTIQSLKMPTDFKSLVANSVKETLQTVTIAAATTTTSTTSSSSTSSGLTTLGANNVTNLPNNNNNDNVLNNTVTAITDDTAVQLACKDAARVNMRERFKKDEDYEPDRFPFSTKFLEK